MTTPLYALTEAYRLLLDTEDEDFTQALADLQEEIEAKAGNVTLVIRHLEAEVKMVDEEIKRLTERKRAASGKADRLRGYLLRCLTEIGLQKVHSPFATITVNPGRERVNVIDQNALPDVYLLTVVTPNLEMIREAIKSGIMPMGIEIVRGEPYITIR